MSAVDRAMAENVAMDYLRDWSNGLTPERGPIATVFDPLTHSYQVRCGSVLVVVSASSDPEKDCKVLEARFI